MLALCVLVASCTEDTEASDTGAESTGSTSSTSDGSTSTAAESTSAADSSSEGTGAPSACTEDDECDDGNPCNGVETCVEGNVCQVGAPPEGAVPCNGVGLCVEGECVPSTCGNGEIEGGEECDDANQTDLDGCTADCKYELFFRRSYLELMPSPAPSFCDRPTSALADIVSPFALIQDNADRTAQVNTGVYNGLLQLTGLDDLTGESSEAISFYNGYGIPDPDGPAWPTDGSNPADAPFLILSDSVAPDGRLVERREEVDLTDGLMLGGPGVTLRPIPEFVDFYTRARFSTEVAPDVPEGGPALRPGLQVVKEIIADGDDEGFCGTITVDYLANTPANAVVEQCLDCPGESLLYTACEGAEVTDTCNSIIDSMVGGCIIGESCDNGLLVITATQPDVDNGGPTQLAPDPDNFNKIPAEQTEGNPNGYSSYFKFRARRVQITGVVDPE